MHILPKIYHRLYQTFGPQNWWPGDSPFEVIVGAVLTQNTSWSNVEKAIENLKNHKALSAHILHEMPAVKLADMIRPAGYFNIKAARLKYFMDFLMNSYSGNIEKMKKNDMKSLREQLLQINGIGPETADSILLYALEKPAFVIDTYTKRVLSKHGIMDYEKSYDEFQELFLSQLKRDVKMFNEYHALFVKVGKSYCKLRKPLCDECPLNDIRTKHNG
jgi:endonuclease III related protein